MMNSMNKTFPNDFVTLLSTCNADGAGYWESSFCILFVVAQRPMTPSFTLVGTVSLSEG